MARDPEKHRQNVLRSYYRHHEENKKRRRESYAARHEKERAEMDPRLASRMEAMRAVPRRVLQQSWTQDLFEKMEASIVGDGGSRDARKTLRWAFRLILSHAEKSGLVQAADLTPAWMAGFPRQTKDNRKEPIYRANFARMLLRLGFWSPEDYKLFKQNLKQSFKRLRRRNVQLQQYPKRAHDLKPSPSPPDELCRLAYFLAYRCGLSLAEMQQLRVGGVEEDGIRCSPNPGLRKIDKSVPKTGWLIPFGNGWDELPKPVLDAYFRKEKPTDYLFFSRSPRDKKRCLSKMTLNGAVAKLRPLSTIASLNEQHLKGDFERARSLQEARFHLRNIHHLDNRYISKRIAGSKRHAGYANEADTVPLPLPYLLAAMCVSRSAPEQKAIQSIPEGGKRHVITWPNISGYEISVDWTRSFAGDLGSRGQKSDRTLRLLYRLAFDFWFEGRRTKLPDIQEVTIRPDDRDLLPQLAATTVMVRDVENPHVLWAGSMFEYANRKRVFRIPLIEDLNRRAWHNQCLACWHPERASIEQEVLEAAIRQTAKKGYNVIARKYGISQQSLAGHRGKKSPRRGRGDTRRSHFSSGPAAPVVRCPRVLFEKLPTLTERELMIYSMLLLESDRADVSAVICSSCWIEQCLGLILGESQLSIALNHLGPTGAGLIDHRKEPQGFSVKLLHRSLTKFASASA
jgi:hypothetical protein